MPTIRDAKVHEIREIVELSLAAFARFQPLISAESWRLWMESVRETIESGQGEMIVAEQDGRLCGSVQFFPDASAISLIKWPAGSASMRVLCVRPESQGQGIGVLLVKECIRRAIACGAGAIYLLTTEHMEAAMRLYEKLGFRRMRLFDSSAFHHDERVAAYELVLGKGEIRKVNY